MSFARFSWIALASLMGAVACGVEPGEETTGTSEAALRKNDPCAAVRCAAGTHCESRGRRASCVADRQNCQNDADCRLVDNYCDGCACEALSATSPDPVCSGTIVACFRQPCGGLVAVCQSGTCQTATASAGEACGPTVCPSGEVCCNASCGICTPPGGVCIQIACAP